MIMDLSHLITIIYRLPLEVVAQGFFAASLVYLLLRRRYGGLRLFSIASGVALTMWLAAVLLITVFERSVGDPVPAQWIPLHSYREVLNGGSRELLRTNFMNVALFYPGGLLVGQFLPEKYPRRFRVITVLLLGAVLSFGIELCQLRFCVGQPEIDDVLHNVLGAVLGEICVLAEPILCKHPPACW